MGDDPKDKLVDLKERLKAKAAKEKGIPVDQDGLMAQLERLGLRESVLELVNAEAKKHNRAMARIVAAAGCRQNPGLDGLCELLQRRRVVAQEAATLGETAVLAVQRGRNVRPGELEMVLDRFRRLRVLLSTAPFPQGKSRNS